MTYIYSAVIFTFGYKIKMKIKKEKNPDFVFEPKKIK